MQPNPFSGILESFIVRMLKIMLRAAVRIVAVLGGYMLATGYSPGPKAFLDAIDAAGLYAIIFALCGALLDTVLRIDRAFWRYSSIADVPRIVRSSALLCSVFLIAAFFIERATQLPRSALLFVFVLDVALTLGLLTLRRLLHEPGLLIHLPEPLRFMSRDERQPLVLLGDLNRIDTFLRDVGRGMPEFRPVAIVSFKLANTPRQIRGLNVVNTADRAHDILDMLLAAGEVPAIVFTDDSITPADLGIEKLGRLRAKGVKLLRVPSLTELGAGDDNRVRELQFEELLPRPPVKLDESELRNLVSGRRVLVTGAGGSIGSEVCRQVAQLGCSHLTLLDQSEFGLFQIDQEIGDRWSTLSRQAVICDVRNRERIAACFAEQRPDIVFHAAALKHVPLMERHPCEAALTNVIGTRNVAEAASAAEAGHMVFISTDKAVAPPNVMGATKRLAESVVRAQQSLNGKTRFSAVRFGNVLGSAGSVVPTFRAQIERGGPVTLTHPDIERYFMTIPEAVQLVLHATATSANKPQGPLGVFVLDMGEPVKIIDLARQLIELHGKVPGRDIEIAVTGLRPGEKLFEELVDSSEQISIQEGSVIVVTDRVPGMAMTAKHLTNIEATARTGDNEATRNLIFDLLAKVRTEATAGEVSKVFPIRSA